MNQTMPQALILASTSRYRRELLERLRLSFSVAAPDVDETPITGETAQDTAIRLAQAKAQSVADRFPAAVVIGSDQVATVDGVLLGKPGGFGAALQQLQTLRGKTALFATALCVIDGRSGRKQIRKSEVRVRFRDLPDGDLRSYLLAEEPYDCAGSAKIEGLGIALCEEVASNDPSSLIGLPLIDLVTMLTSIGFQVLKG